MCSEKPAFAEERRIAIAKMVTERGSVSVSDLCRHFEVSPGTIRNDLRDLETTGRLLRTHGGAIPRQRTGFETMLESRTSENLEAKRTIAELALTVVEQQDTILLDVGTTSYELAQQICQNRTLRAITNDLKIGYLASKHPNIQLHVLGGEVRPGYHCTIGAAVERELADFKVDKAFFGTNGFSLEFGASTPDPTQAEVKRAMIRSSQKTILLCDSGKFESLAFARFAAIDDIDMLITERISKSYLERIEQAGIEVLTARVTD